MAAPLNTTEQTTTTTTATTNVPTATTIATTNLPNVISNVSQDSFKCPPNEHRLQTPWTLYWYNKQTQVYSSNVTEQAYLSNLRSLGTFNSIETFWKHYCHLKKPSALPHGFNIELFRANLTPAWESFPTGGCWIIRVPKNEPFLDRLWEELLMAVIGENFLTPELVGVVLAVRKEIVNITVWNRDNQKNDVRFRIGERLKELLNLDEESTVEYKFFQDAVRDQSTHRNATVYTYTMVDTN